MFAIIKTGGKQYKVQPGTTIEVEKIAADEGTQVQLGEVLLASNNGDVATGRPVIDGAVVTARVVRQFKGPKLIVFRYKSKSRYRRRTGHRQQLTQLRIQSIEIPGWEKAEVEEPTRAQREALEQATEPVPTIQGVVAPVEESATAAPGSAAPAGDVLPVIEPEAQVAAAEDASRPVAGAPEPTEGTTGMPGE